MQLSGCVNNTVILSKCGVASRSILQPPSVLNNNGRIMDTDDCYWCYVTCCYGNIFFCGYKIMCDSFFQI